MGSSRNRAADRRLLAVAFSLGAIAAVQSQTFADEPGAAPIVFDSSSLRLTAADLQEIIDATGATLRGGTARLADCNGAFGYSTIQSAIDASTDGDIVVILPNNCTADGRWHESISIAQKDVRIQSANPAMPAVVASTIIDGGASAQTVLISGQPSNGGSCELDGLTIVNGNNGVAASAAQSTLTRLNISQSLNFGLFLTGANHSAIIEQCRIHQSRGARAQDYILTIRDSEFSNNRASGLSVMGGSIDIRDSQFKDNGLATGSPANGGGLYAYLHGPSLLARCVFEHNRATSGGGGASVSFLDASTVPVIVDIQECLFVGNTAPAGSALQLWGSRQRVDHCNMIGNLGEPAVQFLALSDMYAANCIAWNNRQNADGQSASAFSGNVTITYCNTEADVLAGDGNISADPLFVNAGSWNDNGTPLNFLDDVFVPGDYHLQPASFCVDSGELAFFITGERTDPDGEPRAMRCRADIGWDELTGELSFTADMNGDTATDLTDLPLFTAALLADVPDCIADANADGVVNGADVEWFLLLVLG